MFDLEKRKDDTLIDPDGNYQVKLNEYLFEKLSSGSRSSFGIRMAEDLGIYNGTQWDDTDANSQLAQGWNALPDYEATACIEQLIAVLTSKDPRWAATGRENSDITQANFIADLMTYIWDVSHGGLELKQSVKDYEVKGIGAVMPYIDPNADFGRGEIYIKSIDPQYLYISEDATDPLTKTATHKIYSVVFTGEQIQAMYPKINLKEAKKDISNLPITGKYNPEETVYKPSDTDHSNYRVIDRYSKILVPYYNVYDPFMDKEYNLTEDEYKEFAKQPAIIETTSTTIRYITDPYELEQQEKIIEQFGYVYHYRLNGDKPEMIPGYETHGAIRNSTVQLEETTTGALLEDGSIAWSKYSAVRIQNVLSIGGQLVYDKILPVDSHPIVTFMCNHNRNPFPMSNIRKVKPYIEQLIYYHSILIKHTTRSTNVTVIIGKGSGDLEQIKKKINSPQVEVIEVDWELPGAQPIVLYPQQLSNELFAHIKELKYQIQRILGSYEASDGSPEGAHPTKGGLLAMDEMRMRRAESTRKDIETALNELGSVVAQMIPEAYKGKKIIRLLRPNHAPKEVVLNDPQYNEQGLLEILNDTQMVKYDIQFVSGSMMPSNRWARAEYYMSLWQNGILRDDETILRESEIPNVEQVIEKQSYMKQLEGQLQQASEIIKDLEGQLQTKSREVIQANEKVAVEKTKTKLNQITADVQSEAKAVKAKMNIQKVLDESKRKESERRSKAKQD